MPIVHSVVFVFSPLPPHLPCFSLISLPCSQASLQPIRSFGICLTCASPPVPHSPVSLVLVFLPSPPLRLGQVALSQRMRGRADPDAERSRQPDRNKSRTFLLKVTETEAQEQGNKAEDWLHKDSVINWTKTKRHNNPKKKKKPQDETRLSQTVTWPWQSAVVVVTVAFPVLWDKQSGIQEPEI